MKRLWLLVVLVLAGCKPPMRANLGTYTPADTTAPASWSDVLAAPVDVEVEVIVSARWQVPLKGLLNLKHPKAIEAGKENVPYPIVLPVGVIRHPDQGDFVVDSGVEQAMVDGTKGATRGVLRGVLKKVENEISLAQIIKDKDLDLTAALITHTHVDHVLGLPDIGEVPVVLGPGEMDQKHIQYFLARGSFKNYLAGTLQEIDDSKGVEIGPIQRAYDMLGDGSIWGIHCPGHTPGSMAYLVNATSGPVLFVGDTSHTLWGWDNGVEPGNFTADHEANAKSLAALKELVEAHPEIRVVVGHELEED